MGHYRLTPEKQMTETEKQEVYQLAALGREHGLDLAVKWLMARMLEVELAGKRRQRQRTVTLVDDAGRPVRAGRFKVPESVLKDAEIIE